MKTMNRKIVFKRRKDSKVSISEKRNANFESNVAYYRANPSRFITDYLGLELHDFQRLLIYSMNFYQNFIFIASRGGAKSTVALLFAIQRAILFPKQRIVIVTPVKKQAGRFIEKIREFMVDSPNLSDEIDPSDIKIGENENKVVFKNGSIIFAAVQSENSLGIRSNILICDEYVRCDEKILNRVFLPFLTDTRKPKYRNLTKEERANIPFEANRQLYLSSIRHAEEWSYKKFEKYIERIKKVDKRFITLSLPYHFGVKGGFITRDFIEQYIEDNRDENPELIRAELLGIPERGSGESFFQYDMMQKNRTNEVPLIPMTDNEWIEYKGRKEEWEYYVPKEEGEIRILSMDIAASDAKKSDNTIFWISRMFPDGRLIKYKKELSYGESLNGVNINLQTLRAKQLFYSLEVDYFAIDTGGVGFAVSDDAMRETIDEIRGEVYPAWKFYNEDGAKNNERCFDDNAVAVMYAIVPSSQSNHKMYINAKKYLDSEDISLLVEPDHMQDILNKKYGYYKINDQNITSRLLSASVQTNLLIYESINLVQTSTGASGYIKLENKSNKRKDRMSSFVYNMWMCRVLEDEFILSNQQTQGSFLDYIMYT